MVNRGWYSDQQIDNEELRQKGRVRADNFTCMELPDL